MRFLPIFLALATLLAGCAAPASRPNPDAAPSLLVHSVQEGDRNIFDPVELRVSVGSTVTWDIVGEGHHTIDFLQAIDAAGAMPKSGDVGPGQTFEVTFTQAGEYDYYCKYHSNKVTGMVGKIRVA